MFLYYSEIEQALSTFKAWSWSNEKDLKNILFEELLNLVNKNNIEELEAELLKVENVTDTNDLPTQYRIYWQDLKDFINQEEEEEE